MLSRNRQCCFALIVNAAYRENRRKLALIQQMAYIWRLPLNALLTIEAKQHWRLGLNVADD